LDKVGRVNDSVERAPLFAANRNDESSVTNRNDLILQLIGMRRAFDDRLQTVCQSRPRDVQRASNPRQFGTVAIVDLAVMDGAAKVLVQVAQVWQAMSRAGEPRESFAIVFPAAAKAFDLTQKTLNRLDLRYLQRGTGDRELVKRFRQQRDVRKGDSKFS
jgi:hypothetical protein